MGQYYRNVILRKNWKSANGLVEATLYPHNFLESAKLMGFSWINDGLMKRVEWLLANDYNGYPYVCVGDYADIKGTEVYPLIMKDGREIGGVDVFAEAERFEDGKGYSDFLKTLPKYDNIPYYKYAVNYSKGEYIILPEGKPNEDTIHPLSLLCADGNGRGGGDYWGSDEELIGRWAYDSIGVTNNKDEIEGFTKLMPKFKEGRGEA